MSWPWPPPWPWTTRCSRASTSPSVTPGWARGSPGSSSARWRRCGGSSSGTWAPPRATPRRSATCTRSRPNRGPSDRDNDVPAPAPTAPLRGRRWRVWRRSERRRGDRQLRVLEAAVHLEHLARDPARGRRCQVQHAGGGHREGGGDVEVAGLLEAVLARAQRLPRHPPAGVVDQDVDATELLHCGLDERLQLASIVDVALHGQGPPAQGPHLLGRRV